MQAANRRQSAPPGRRVTTGQAAFERDPEHDRLHALALAAAGQHDEAAAIWQRLYALRPDRGEFAVQLGRALSNAGRQDAALAALVAATGRHAAEPGLLMQTGLVLLRLGRAEQAVGALLLAVDQAPEDTEALSALGIAFLHCDDLEQAQRYAIAAFQRDPSHANAVNLSRILLDAGAFAAAEAVSLHAVQLESASLPARNNHALALEGLGRHEEAVRAWEEAAALAPGDPDVAHKLSTLLLGLGRMTPETWSLYERRLDGSGKLADVRRWHGEDVAGKTVLLHAEQGLGDTLQFVRYAPLVAATGARVVLAVQPSLVRWLAAVPGVSQVVQVGDALPHFDVFCPMLSLPAIFRTTLATIPPPLPHAAPQAREPGPLRVGLVWAGNPGFVNDRRRSVPPALLAPLTHLPGVRFYSLQFGAAPLPPALCIAPGMEDVRDFADTADRIAQLDLVIAVDTAVAHLAASMGKPVWLLSRFLGCWRWLLGRSDTPWYPSMRIYRQVVPNDWADAIAAIEHDLAAWAAQSGSIQKSA